MPQQNLPWSLGDRYRTDKGDVMVISEFFPSLDPPSMLCKRERDDTLHSFTMDGNNPECKLMNRLTGSINA